MKAVVTVKYQFREQEIKELMSREGYLYSTKEDVEHVLSLQDGETLENYACNNLTKDTKIKVEGEIDGLYKEPLWR